MLIQLIDPDPGADGSAERHARIVPVLGGQLVLAGETIDVPDEVAGRAAHWRQPEEGDDLAFSETRLNDDGTVRSIHDLGFGLLAQPEVWAKPGVDLGKGDE
jgi:hypothetical protein